MSRIGELATGAGTAAISRRKAERFLIIPLKEEDMRQFLSKVLLICFLCVSSESIFAQRKGNYTILHDKQVKYFNKDSIIYKDEFVNEVNQILYITKNDLQRERILEVPKELEKFYQIYDWKDLSKKFSLKLWMSVDSPEGLRVRKEPSLNSEKICTLPDNFNVIMTCLGKGATVDDIKSAWVEILLPQYLWSGPKAEFGWVFGGYLKDYKNNAEENGNRHYEFCEDDLYPPYNSPALYELTDGYTAYDRYFLAHEKIRWDRWGGEFSAYSDSEKIEYYEYPIKSSPGLLKLMYAGVQETLPPGWTFIDGFFNDLWSPVREMRQIHPVNFTVRSDSPNSIQIDDCSFHNDGTVSVDLENEILTYTNPDSKKVFKASIPADYRKDFSTRGRDELEFNSYQNEKMELSQPFICMKKRVYENECVFHNEIFFYHIKDGELIKFLKIITCPEILKDNHYYSFKQYYDNQTEPIIDTYCISFFYDLIHDFSIEFKSCEEFPYIKFKIDESILEDYDVIQLGPNCEGNKE
jgi:hypothetical protein